MRPALEVADIFRRHGPVYRQTHEGRLGRSERRVMSAIELCRTPALGGHVEACDDCDDCDHIRPLLAAAMPAPHAQSRRANRRGHMETHWIAA